MLLPKIESGLAPSPPARDLDARRLLEADLREHLVHETTPGSSGPAEHVPRKVDS